MKPKPYTIGASTKILSCVVKLSYSEGFVIVKCKEMFTTLKAIEKGLNSFIRGGINNPKGFYYHLNNYVKDNPGHKFSYEVLLESENGYELLKTEHQAIRDNLKNPNMLNNASEAYIPAYDEASQMYGWISRQSVLNFQKWLKKHPRKRAV